MSDKQDLQPLLEIRQNQLGLIFSYAESLDTKNLAILAANVAALLFGLQVIMDLSSLPGISVFGFYSASIVANIAGVWPLGYIGAGVSIDEHPEYLSMPGDDLVLQLIADTQHAISFNQRLNSIKFRLWLGSMVLTVAGTFMLVWAIL